jgi:hypothetical protein
MSPTHSGQLSLPTESKRQTEKVSLLDRRNIDDLKEPHRQALNLAKSEQSLGLGPGSCSNHLGWPVASLFGSWTGVGLKMERVFVSDRIEHQ